jgi:hypothetical protein
MSTQEAKVYIEKYSDKSFVVRGDTRPHRESLKAMGGKWANRLTDKESGEKFGAWLFWTQKHAELDGWVSGGCKAVEGSQASGKTPGRTSDLELRMTRIEASLARMERLIVKMSDFMVSGEVIEEEDENEEKPKRLLGK